MHAPASRSALRMGTAACTILLAAAEGWCAAVPCREIKVSGADQWVPVAFQDPETKSARGIAYDFSRWLGEQLNIPVSIKVGIPWLRFIEHLDHGEVDMMAGNYWNKAFAARYVLTEPIASDEVRIWVRKGEEFAFRGPEDLVGRKGAALLGIRWSDDFMGVKPRLSLTEVSRHEQGLRMLMHGRVEYVVMPALTARYWLRQVEGRERIVALAQPLAVQQVHLSFSRASPCQNLVGDVNRLIRKAKATGVLDRILASYSEP